MDFVKLKKKVLNKIQKDEKVIQSFYITKHTSKDLKVIRIMVLTESHIYHVVPPDLNLLDMLKQIMRSEVKRKMQQSNISAISVDFDKNEFAFHFDNDYDQKYSCPKDQLSQTLLVITNIICKEQIKKINFYFYNNIFELVTQQKEYLQGVKRPLKGIHFRFGPQDLREYLKENSHINQKQIDQTNIGMNIDIDISISHFKIYKQIGIGGFAKVYLGALRGSSELLAIKAFSKQEIIESHTLDCIRNERKILQKIKHPFIMSLKYAFTNFMVNGDLYSVMQIYNKFNEDQTRFIVAQIALGLQHLHENKIAYRDLKPENILISKSKYIKIADFGLSKYILANRSQSFVGTDEYIAPEIYMQSGHDESVDWWSLGVITYELLVGKTPFHNSNKKILMDNVISYQYQIPPNTYISKNCEHFIKSLLKSQKERLGHKDDQDVLDHAWFQDIDLKKLLKQEIESPLTLPDKIIILEQEIQIPEDQNDQTSIETFDNELYGVSYSKDLENLMN